MRMRMSGIMRASGAMSFRGRYRMRGKWRGGGKFGGKWGRGGKFGGKWGKGGKFGGKWGGKFGGKGKFGGRFGAKGGGGSFKVGGGSFKVGGGAGGGGQGSWSSSSKSGGSWSSGSSGGSTSWSVSGGGKNKQGDTQSGNGGPPGSTNNKGNSVSGSATTGVGVKDGRFDTGQDYGGRIDGGKGDVAEVTSKIDGNHAGVGGNGEDGEALSDKLVHDGTNDNQLNDDGNKQEKTTNDDPTGTIPAGTNTEAKTDSTGGHRGKGELWKWGKKNTVRENHIEYSKLYKYDHPEKDNGLNKSFKKEINGLKKNDQKTYQTIETRT